MSHPLGYVRVMREVEVEARCCVFCGRPVRKTEDRALCANHKKMAVEIDRRLWRRVLGYPLETPPIGVPVVRDRDGYT